MDNEQNFNNPQTQQLNITGVSGSTLTKVECPHCYADGLQIEFKEHYADNWKEYRCKVCNRLFMHK